MVFDLPGETNIPGAVPIPHSHRRTRYLSSPRYAGTARALRRPRASGSDLSQVMPQNPIRTCSSASGDKSGWLAPSSSLTTHPIEIKERGRELFQLLDIAKAGATFVRPYPIRGVCHRTTRHSARQFVWPRAKPILSRLDPRLIEEPPRSASEDQ